ncbi:MAG: hypothetical protein Q8M09_13125 [Pseudomonadota bacterium]|nr:hypothetical protein [Pseudomonadota bacterium]MDP1905169.1 hypothetical protein [Pseudomonadota bacterium]
MQLTNTINALQQQEQEHEHATDPAALAAASREYVLRQNGKLPPGTWEQRGWMPSEAETCPCCATVHGPHRGGPAFGFLSHCRGAKHVAALFCVTEAALRNEIKRQAREERVAQSAPWPDPAWASGAADKRDPLIIGL